ncbi:MAG: protease Lon-related BREX system protein BrxL [Candidatus Methanomarinus sp.]|uniref:Protease Lon-related BREX system protein BrxL n=1 Tax=Candidatus Methanomarinus sp. TaxID=3386244 RepID=A0AC61SAR0_9EURY|nr:MAG: protease Lon-related BREX system protein BrxL [ANME-2 cluster archaeon]
MDTYNLDDLDNKLSTIFPGRIVKKDLVRQMKSGINVPVYVLEYLLGKYCASTDKKIVEEGLEYVKDTLSKHYCRPDESEKIKSYIKEKNGYRVIDKIKVRLIETENQYWASLTNLGIDFVNIPEDYITKYEKLLEGGIWALIDVGYDEEVFHKGKNRPFLIRNLKPIQSATINLDDIRDKRANFSRDEWLDLILRSIGMEPSHEDMTQRQKLLLLTRLIPLVENNYNLIELGPRGTGKSFVFREVTPFSILLSGGRTTVSNLFMHMGTGRVGLVGFWDVIAFDEVAGIKFADSETVQILRDYMELGSFSRGKEEVSATASMVFNGNIDDIETALESGHLFAPLPVEMQTPAFIERLHCYIPGWELNKLQTDSFTTHYGFIVDYLSEIFREMKKYNYINVIDNYFSLGNKMSTRDSRAINKTVSGLVKILHPDGNFTKDELREYLIFAIEMKYRIIEQLKKIGGAEYWKYHHSYIDNETGIEEFVEVPEIVKYRSRKIELGKPKVGRIYGLAATGFGGSLIILEVESMPGRGHLKMTGGLQKTIKESISTAYDYLRANYEKYDIEKNYFYSHDIHFQAVEIAIPKEGPSAGITIATVLLSAATSRKIKSNMAMTGELTIHGEVLPVGGISEKATAAYENGIEIIIVPKRNEKDVENLSEEIKKKINFIFVEHIDQVINEAFVEGPIFSGEKIEYESPQLPAKSEVSEEIEEHKMLCPDHGNVSLGYLQIEYSRPILICGDCEKTLILNCNKFVLDTNILVTRLFSNLLETDFFDGKTILIPETVVDEINNWKNHDDKWDLYKIAIGEIKKIRSAHDQGKLKYQVIGKEALYSELIEKGRPDKIIAKDAEKEDAIVITGDKDFFSINPDISVITYRYYPPKEDEIIEIRIVGESDGDGVGYYKNYTIFVHNIGNRRGEKVTAKIIDVFFNKRIATAYIIE